MPAALGSTRSHVSCYKAELYTNRFKPLHEDNVTGTGRSLADGDLEVQVKDAKAPLDVGHNFELDSVQIEPEPSNENSP